VTGIRLKSGTLRYLGELKSVLDLPSEKGAFRRSTEKLVKNIRRNFEILIDGTIFELHL
jgi:hypothetical protein